jgi:CubicO group peptidase (beta-lactamase class C family)
MRRFFLLPWLLATVGLLSFDAIAAAVPERLDDGWPVADAVALGWNAERLQALDAAIAGDAVPDTTSVLIVHRGALVYERYANGATRDSLHNTRSATKSVTALLVGVAIDRGLLPGVDAHVFDYFRDRSWAHDGPAKAHMTLADLLTMSAQWECDDNNTFSSGHEERMYLSADWVQFALDLPARGYAPWTTRPEASPHGRAFAYCTANPFLLGAILERASGQRLAAFARDVLEGPLGIATSSWQTSSEGAGMGGGGTAYRSRDLAKFGQLLVDGGRWQGRQVVSAGWVDAMTTPQARTSFDADYGYLTWRFPFQARGRAVHAWTMSGNGGNYVFALPEERLVVVVTRTRYNRPGMHQETQKLFGDIVLEALP